MQKCITPRYLVKKKREEMIQLTKHYFLTSPEVIQVSQELEKLLNMLRKGECYLKDYVA
ncbi:aspartyl-phosphate phosphatase Spo0E family protein [Bacillus mycoides]|uniref:aspartyl-phosphate phosphatase Spo0E family protein n=1 Tax=Bacillus mycoides TaxID=1405 RepID=UPI001C014AB4|nr:aspartyl-phosphate phosphatase Spo0E family protein [Bacillus mycoides]QWI52623.1 aspartyl-phosphate phosphatase Spo0E family protein [Bacillus mycoides]